MWWSRRLALVLGFAAVLASATARAQEPPAQPDYEAAKRHYQAAEEASGKGDHAAAAREYGIAYDITKDPVLFFKIGQSYDRAGDCKSAQVYYGRYLKEGNPPEEFRKKTEEAMQACAAGKPAGERETSTGNGEPGTGATTTGDRQPATGDRQPATGDRQPATGADGEAVGGVTVPPSLEDEEPSWQRTAAWTSVGIGIALLTTGAVLGLSAASREEDVGNLIDFRDAENRPATYTGATRDRYEDLIEEGERLESLAVVAFAATGVAAASAVLFFVLDARASDEAAGGASLRPTAGPSSVGMTWGWSF